MPSFYTFHESNFSWVQMVKIELSKIKLPKYRFSNSFCETFCTYKVTKYNAQSLVPGITKHLPLVPEDPYVNFLFGISATVRTVNAQSCTALHSQCTVVHSNAPARMMSRGWFLVPCDPISDLCYWKSRNNSSYISESTGGDHNAEVT